MRESYGVGGYDPAKPNGNLRSRLDASGFTRWDETGAVIEQRALTAEEAADVDAAQARDGISANLAGLKAKAATALDANRTYLAIATPTTAQMRAQLERVTRQTNALIRLVVGLLDDTSDT